MRPQSGDHQPEPVSLFLDDEAAQRVVVSVGKG